MLTNDQDVQIAEDELAKLRRVIRPLSPHRQRAGGGRISAENSPFMGMNQVLELVPVSRSMLYLMLKEGSFPQPKHLGARAVVWSRAEVAAWIAEKLA